MTKCNFILTILTCFALVSCGSDNSTSSPTLNTESHTEPERTVSITAATGFQGFLTGQWAKISFSTQERWQFIEATDEYVTGSFEITLSKLFISGGGADGANVRVDAFNLLNSNGLLVDDIAVFKTVYLNLGETLIIRENFRLNTNSISIANSVSSGQSVF